MEVTELDLIQQASGGIPRNAAADTHGTLAVCRPAMVHFGDPLAELNAVHLGAALFDVSDRVQLQLIGPDAKSFLHSFCTNHVTSLGTGHGCEAFVTNVKGKILNHVAVFVTDTDVWLEMGPCDEDALVAHFDRYVIREKVEFLSRTLDLGELLLVGPEAARLIAQVLGVPEALGRWQHGVGILEDEPVVVRRSDLVEQPAYLLSAIRPLLPRLWSSLVQAGAVAAGAEVFHASRILAGFPLYGVDLTGDNLAQEAGRTTEAISFTKGCYLGQEPIARVDALGHVNRRLCRLQVESESPPDPGSRVISDTGEAAGAVTSAARVVGSPHCVALALLRANCSLPGTSLSVVVGEQPQPASVAG
jgi:folate-binding protein YgfZ